MYRPTCKSVGFVHNLYQNSRDIEVMYMKKSSYSKIFCITY